MENCTTDAECEALDNCGRYKCDTGAGECYLPWGSEPCGSVVRGVGVGRGYRKLTNRKNINNMRRVRRTRGYAGRPTSGLSPIIGSRGRSRARRRGGRAPVNKPYVVQQMVNRGISLALATQFANKISSWWNQGGYRGVTQRIRRNFSGGGSSMQGASRSLRTKYARGWTTPYTTQYASNSLRGQKLGMGMGRPPVCPPQGGKECWLCNLFGGGVSLGNGVTLDLEVNPAIEWDIGAPLDLSIDLGGGNYKCGITISF